ncbi:MAG: HAMP domain-containing protein [Chloroflexi bacterium]|nr:HAMP domain-containing protein [Chloroflexota bacterium]
MNYSLRTRLILSFLVIIVATAGLVVLLANRITANRFNYMVSRAGQMRARNLSSWFANYYAQVGSWDGVDTFIESYLDGQWRPPGRRGQQGGGMPMMGMGTESTIEERLLLVDANGQLVADSEDENTPIHLSGADLDKGAPIIVANRQVGTLFIASSLGRLTADQTNFLKQVNRLMLLTAVVAVLAVLVVGSFQAQRIVAPVKALVEAAGRVAGGDLSQRISVTSQDELGEMATAFNTMAAELERQQDLRHRAMADIAHELRTPLSVLQIELESIEDGLTTPTPEVVTGLQTDVAHIHRLVEDLRTLSLADAGELQLEADPVEMGDLIRGVVNRVRGVARSQNITLETQLPDAALPVTGDDQRLAQVLLNLLSNALQHTPPDGQITVTAQQIKDKVHVTVQDTGEGIPAQDLPHIFERFYRADRARSRDTGGSGLGLSITRSLVEAHGGRIWAHSAEGDGSAFTFALPLVVGA